MNAPQTPEQATRWNPFKRPRFDVVQIQNGRVVKIHDEAVRRGEAVRDAATVNQMLLMCRLLAPSGPQDAHARVVPTGSMPLFRDGDPS